VGSGGGSEFTPGDFASSQFIFHSEASRRVMVSDPEGLTPPPGCSRPSGLARGQAAVRFSLGVRKVALSMRDHPRDKPEGMQGLAFGGEGFDGVEVGAITDRGRCWGAGPCWRSIRCSWAACRRFR
jgi:hypothetical protein